MVSASPPSSAHQPTEPAFRALLRTVGLLKRVMEPYFARFGISGSQWAMLITLYRAEEDGVRELRLSDLGDRLLIRPPSVTGVVDRLVRLGYLDRTTASDDHRAKLVRLTPAGRQIVRQILEQHAEQIKRVLGIFAAEEQQQLQQLLERLGTHLESMTAERNGQAHSSNSVQVLKMDQSVKIGGNP